MNTAFANSCFKLTDYKLTPASHYSDSEQSAFKKKKFSIYRSLILNENKLSNYYSAEIEALYETETSDADLTSKIKALESKKTQSIKENCKNHKKKMKELFVR